MNTVCYKHETRNTYDLQFVINRNYVIGKGKGN